MYQLLGRAYPDSVHMFSYAESIVKHVTRRPRLEQKHLTYRLHNNRWQYVECRDIFG